MCGFIVAHCVVYSTLCFELGFLMFIGKSYFGLDAMHDLK
jgi:hypothetical protein